MMLPRLPTLFVAHGGGPLPLLGVDKETQTHLKSLQSHVGVKPKAVLVVSAHWESSPVKVMASPKPGMLFDYYGFPPETYEYKYEAPGDPVLAQQIKELLNGAAIKCDLDATRDFDHGVFVPGLLAYPDADIPFVALSLDSSMDPKTHLAIGAALKPLRDQGVLIIGSGMSFHNLKKFQMKGRNAGAPLVGQAFDTALTDALAKSKPLRDAALLDWTKLPEARLSHPREEHFIPLLVAAGAAGDDDIASRIFHDSILGAAVSAFKFG